MVLVESSTLYLQLLVFLFGCCFGSFYNVVIYRLPRGESIVRPGSRCPACGSALSVRDNFPLLSFFLLRAKCRRCGASISFRYPVIELTTGLLALLLFRRYGLHPQFAVEFFFVSLLLIISVIDLDTFIIPNSLSLPGIVLGVLLSFFTPRMNWESSLLGVLIGGGLFYLVSLVFELVRKKEGMGGGDIKLLAMIGAFLGWQGVLFTILVSSVAGTLVSIPLMLFKGRGLGSEIPYGPFLSFGAAAYIFLGQGFAAWYFSSVLGV